MARIAGIDLPRQKRVNIALTYIYGIGQPRSARILRFADSGRTPTRAPARDRAKAQWQLKGKRRPKHKSGC